MSKPSARRRAWLIAGASCTPFLAAAPAWSQEDVASQLKTLRALVEAQSHELETQHESLEAQGQLLHDQAAEIETLKAQAGEPAKARTVRAAEPSEALMTFRGRGLDAQTGLAEPAPAQPAPAPPPPAPPAPAQPAPTQPNPGDQSAPPPAQPVGEAPPSTPSQAAAAVVSQALPEFMGVLTSPGHWVFEPQFEYVHASTNQLIFEGVQIVPGLQIGLIDATTADRNTFVGALDIRTGVTNRFEIEVRAPYLFRHDQTTTLNQQSTTENITETISSHDIGDVELIGRYQVNSSRNSSAIWILALDAKSDTGVGPYQVPYDQFGVAQRDTTGSGFWSIEPTINVLFPSDPVVLFFSAGYIYSISRTFNFDITPNVEVQRVNPGGSPVVALGFAFALNDRFSYSLGFKFSYIRPTQTELNKVWTTSAQLEVGQSTFGLSYRISPTINLSDTFQFGVTRDAPDIDMLTRLSFYF